MDEPYTNREIDSKYQDITDALIRIETQTTKTNGHVADINKWRERMNGGAVVAGVFMTFVVMPILAWSLIVLVNLPNTINNGIQEALVK